MNYYKLQFNKQDTEAFRVFQTVVKMRYGADLWGPCETSFILFATPDDAEKVMHTVDVSKDKWTSNLVGVDSLQLALSTAHVDDPTLPDDARKWFIKTIEAVATLHDFLDKHDSSTRK